MGVDIGHTDDGAFLDFSTIKKIFLMVKCFS